MNDVLLLWVDMIVLRFSLENGFFETTCFFKYSNISLTSHLLTDNLLFVAESPPAPTVPSGGSIIAAR